MPDEQYDRIAVFQRIVQTGGHVDAGKFGVGFERLPGLDLCTLILQRVDNFDRRALKQIVHVRFIGEAECGYLFIL